MQPKQIWNVWNPPVAVSRWQSGERLQSTQFSRKTPNQVIPVPDIQLHVMPAASRPSR
jgi:hypothetical protein